MTPRDKAEFRGYLRQCTDAQVQGVYDRERIANRMDYAELAEDEAYRRKITLDKIVDPAHQSSQD